MATSNMKPIRVHILGREYALRVREGEESMTRQLAAQLNARMEAFQDEHPEQAKLTTALITALAMAEEINDLRAELESARREAQEAHEQEKAMQLLLSHMSEQLSDALPAGALPVDPESAPALPEDNDTSSIPLDLSSASDGHSSVNVSPPAPAVVTGSSQADSSTPSDSDSDTADDPSSSSARPKDSERDASDAA